MGMFIAEATKKKKEEVNTEKVKEDGNFGEKKEETCTSKIWWPSLWGYSRLPHFSSLIASSTDIQYPSLPARTQYPP